MLIPSLIYLLIICFKFQLASSRAEMSNEIDFPRGGTPKILHFRTNQHRSEKENEQKESTRKRSAKPGIQTGKTTETKAKKIKTEEEADRIYEDVFRQTISVELLSQNLRGLAFVKYIGDLDVTLECVDGMQLKLPADKISRIFTEQMANTKATLEDIFSKGQAFAFKMAQNSEKRVSKHQKCTITICPHEVNSFLLPTALLAGTALNGMILSREDKGAIIDLGFSTSSVKGFIQKEDLPAYLALDQLHIGQVALFRVKERPTAESRVIKLTAFVEMDSLEDGGNVNGKQLMPGTVVQVQPEKMVFDGLFVGIKNGPKAYIRKVHLPPRLRFDPARATKPFRACVLCSHPNTSMLVLGAHPDVVAISKVEKRLLPPEVKIGSRITGTIYHVDKKHNVYLKLEDENEKLQMLTAKCLRINIDNVEENIHKFSIGSEHQCRVIGYASVERQLLVSAKKADLAQNKVVISAEEAEPGTKLRGTVKAITQRGLLVDLGNELVGFVGAMHALDQPMPNWQKRFHRDQPLLCRILFANPLSNRIMLTAKPSLVKKATGERLVTSFDSQFQGALTTGVVIKQLEGGSLLVAFFNRVAGILHQSKIVGLPAESTQTGAPIKVLVRRVDPALAKMELDLPPTEDGSSIAANTTAIGIEMVDGKRQRKTKSNNNNKTEQTKLVKHAKPFVVYTATVVGPWPYEGTAKQTTAELLLPGGAVGRFHASELNNLHEFPEGSCPMEQYLQMNKGKTLTVKVLCVSKKKALTKPGQELLRERRQSDRVVECTAIPWKLQEARKKLSLLNYRSDYGTGSLVPVFLTGNSASTKSAKGFCGEINPDFQALIPLSKIKIVSVVERIAQMGGEGKSVDFEDIFVKGELRYGRVIGVNKTKRGRTILLELVDMTEAGAGREILNNTNQLQKLGRLKRRKSGGTEKEAEASTKEKVGQEEVKNEQQSPEKEVKEENDVDEKDEEEEEESDEDEGFGQAKSSAVTDAQLKGEALASVDGYEQQLLANPSSIPLYVGFIHFYVSSGRPSANKRYEVGKAVAERALKTITFQNDADLATMWKAYLNLEVALGTQESLRHCFKRACAASKSLEMHKYLIQLLKQQPNAEGRQEEIRECYESMVTKFRDSSLEPWFAYARHLMQRGEADDSRQLLKRELQCNPRRKHFAILNKFIQLEERFGDKERAKTMQELVNNYKEEGTKQLKNIQQSLERAIGGGGGHGQQN